MKEDYRWNYDIRIKTKEGTFEYENEDLRDIDLLHKELDEISKKLEGFI